MPEDTTNFSWDIGIYFSEKDAFKDAIRSYVVHPGINLKIIKNVNRRAQMKCNGAEEKC